MKLLHLLFNLLEPENNRTWLSIKFSQWQTAKRERWNANFRKYDIEKSHYFEVKGAGDIYISDDCTYSCANKTGFQFAVEWGTFGFLGGVIGKDEAKKMAEFLLSKSSN